MTTLHPFFQAIQDCIKDDYDPANEAHDYLKQKWGKDWRKVDEDERHKRFDEAYQAACKATGPGDEVLVYRYHWCEVSCPEEAYSGYMGHF